MENELKKLGAVMVMDLREDSPGPVERLQLQMDRPAKVIIKEKRITVQNRRLLKTAKEKFNPILDAFVNVFKLPVEEFGAKIIGGEAYVGVGWNGNNKSIERLVLRMEKTGNVTLFHGDHKVCLGKKEKHNNKDVPWSDKARLAILKAITNGECTFNRNGK